MIDFARDGIAVIAAVIARPKLRALCSLPEIAFAGRPGGRRFTLSPLLQELIIGNGPVATLARRLMGTTARPVRVLCFDKTAVTNWSVPWHQDRTIAVKARVDVAGYGPWTTKGGVHHVEPPADLLAGMVALRIHLDDCGPDNGPLLVRPGSWRLGRLTAQAVKTEGEKADAVALTAAACDVVAMRGLTLHASRRAVRPGHRRVVHVDYATTDLPNGLEWAFS